jgi:hypothetical protein
MLKLKRLLFHRPSFICHFGQRTYKVFTLAGKPFKRAEIKGNSNALEHEFWRGQVVEVTPKFFYLEMARGKPLVLSQHEDASFLVEAKLQEALTHSMYRASEAFDFKFLRKLENHGLNPGLLEQAESTLSTISLPLTSAHGDLHLGNMIRIGQKVKIIDWSMFSSKGSFVTDYIHFYNHQHAERTNASWTQSIIEEHDYLQALGRKLALHPDYLRLAYALSRISGATAQWEHVKRVPHLEITKYNFVLNQILKTLTTDAIV